MDRDINLAKNILFEAKSMYETPEAERYELIFRKYPEFTKVYPLVIKYICFDFLFDVKLFGKLLIERAQKIPKFEDGFVLQADYIKNLLIKRAGLSKIQAKKISNIELENALSQIRKIKKSEESLKKQYARENKESEEILRKELLEFVLNNCV